jgi:hypothetical protein
LPALKRLAETGWTVTAQFGHEQQDGHSHSAQRQGLKLLHIDNRVDRISQTFKFYLPLPNDIESSVVDDLGRTFLQWRFRPGQRVHLRLPVERWENQLLVPIDAVVMEGPHAYVFAEHVDHVEVKSEDQDLESVDPNGADNTHFDPDHANVFVELEPIPVRLLHRDSEVAVLADDGQISPEDRIALNHAFKLHLAMKMQAGGDAAHHHHDH